MLDINLTEWIVIYLVTCALSFMASRYLMRVDEEEDVFFFFVIMLIPIINLVLVVVSIFHKIHHICTTGKGHLVLRKLFGLK